MVENELEGPIALVFDTTEFAGAELYAAVLVDHLRDNCKFVALLGSGSAQETRARLAEAGAEVMIVPGLRRRPSPAAVIRLLRMIRSVRPALVHVNLSDQGDGLGALAAGVLARRPLIATLHLVIPGRARWREAVSRFALRRFRAVIAVSHAVGRYLGDRDIPAVVVMNGLDPTPAAHDPRGELGLEGDGILVGGVGRLHEQKGWDILCRAAALVRRERPDATFAVIGGGDEGTSLTSMPECEEVRFLGYRPQAASLIPAFDILAVPSRYEGLGLTPLEALFQGVPVVASNIEGLAEVLGDCAVLVPPENPEALAGAILHVASDAELRADLIKRGRERAHRLFSAERMSRETFTVYRDAASSEVVGATVRP